MPTCRVLPLKGRHPPTRCPRAACPAPSRSLAVPMLVLAAAVAFLLRPPPPGSIDEGRLFQDESTGTLFEAAPGSAPERDRRGELAFRAIRSGLP